MKNHFPSRNIYAMKSFPLLKANTFSPSPYPHSLQHFLGKKKTSSAAETPNDLPGLRWPKSWTSGCSNVSRRGGWVVFLLTVFLGRPSENKTFWGENLFFPRFFFWGGGDIICFWGFRATPHLFPMLVFEETLRFNLAM